MKKIEAIIKPYLLEDVKEALQELGVIGMTVSEIRNFMPAEAGTPAPQSTLRQDPVDFDFAPRLKLEIVVGNEAVKEVIGTLQHIGMEHDPGEKLYVQELEDVIRIRTCEHGAGAI